MLEVFFKDKVLFIGSDPCLQEFFPFNLKTQSSLDLLTEVLTLSEVKGACWEVEDENLAIDKLKFFTSYVQAAGGLIMHENRFLGIFRRGMWDLPKGKRDKGESISETALREIQEETGLVVENPIYICKTFHTYSDPKDKSRLCLKETFWYKFNIQELQELSLQAEEQIEMAKWFDAKDPGPFIRNTYRSLESVLTHL